jgi:glycosyltransferase involved in cell wall biosynthesis
VKKNLYIITNESISLSDNSYRCDNIDIKAIPESLSNLSFDVEILARKSKIVRSKKIDLEKINIFNNIFSYIFALVKTFKKNDNKYLIVSVTPYTLLAIIFLKVFKKKPFVYLRSDGHEEYKSILGFYGPWIYHLMFSVAVKSTLLIACRKHLLKGRNGKIVHPSHLNEKWFANQKKTIIKSNTLLYVGRIRIEKGIFSLINILKKSSLKLTIVTPEKENRISKLPDNILVVNFQNKNDSIITFYDTHSIFILPSFTEAHPQVLDEALARNKPVIIFQEISHVIRNRKGVFVTKRNIESLQETINYITKNYETIQQDIKTNTLPTKIKFIEELRNIILEK